MLIRLIALLGRKAFIFRKVTKKTNDNTYIGLGF